ncbi:hypothetical protein [Streptomyces cyaneofuscatus]|uniref:hypothetical protein n=1 Tax=Streptomyces cyaneofuscatus TaxID=66883 RepID=UPI0033275C81
MPSPTTPAHNLLLLATRFTRHTDALTAIQRDGTSPAAELSEQVTAAQRIAAAALDIMDDLNDQQMWHSPAIRSVYTRVRQLAYMATGAADHLLDAVDILLAFHEGVPAEESGLVLTRHQALSEAGRREYLASILTSLGAADCLKAAELYVTDRRRSIALPRPPALSPAQTAMLRAVAQGEVMIDRDKPSAHRLDIRLTISTVRALESRSLVTREEYLPWSRAERVHLTQAGCRTLAAALGGPSPRPLTTLGPVSRPAATPTRTPSR